MPDKRDIHKAKSRRGGHSQDQKQQHQRPADMSSASAATMAQSSTSDEMSMETANAPEMTRNKKNKSRR